jgi:hypothetical protein
LFEAVRLQAASRKERVWREENAIQEGEYDGRNNFDFASDEELEELGKLAGEAVDQFDGVVQETGRVNETSRIDWSVLTIANLKSEMKKRGLKCTGNKAKLVAALEENDANLVQMDSAAIDLQLEAMYKIPVAPSDSKPANEVESVSAMVDFEDMTVAQLREELKARGLKVGGKKSELIERLAAL